MKLEFETREMQDKLTICFNICRYDPELFLEDCFNSCLNMYEHRVFPAVEKELLKYYGERIN